MTLQRKDTIPRLVVAHFPPFDTVKEPLTVKPCGACSGLGCDDCCHTGAGTTVVERQQNGGGAMTPTEALTEGLMDAHASGVRGLADPSLVGYITRRLATSGWRLCGPDDVRKVDAWDVLMEDVKATTQRTGLAVSLIDRVIDGLVVTDLQLEVAAEGERAKVIHGEPPDRDGRDWLAILAEEFGEVAKEVTQGEVPPVNRPRDEYLSRLRKELVQTASVSMRWLAALGADKEGQK